MAATGHAADPVAPARRASRARLGGLVRYLQTPVILSVIVIAVAIIAPAINGPLTPTTIVFLVNVIVVLGLSVFVGNSGVVSFGHISFMALGAYVWTLLTIPTQIKHTLYPDMPGWLAGMHASVLGATFIALACAGLAGLVVGVFLGRLNGIAASIGTFALLLIVQVVLSNWDAVTNGTVPLTGAPSEPTVSKALVWTVVAIFVAYVFRESRSGLRLRASREDEAASAAIGVNVFKERVIALAISGAIVGVAGVLYADFLGSIYPGVFYLDITLITLAMLVVGGIRSVSGAVIGCLFISVIVELFDRAEQGVDVFGGTVKTPPGVTQIVVAAVILAALIVRPAGLTKGNEIGFKSVRVRRRQRTAADNV